VRSHPRRASEAEDRVDREIARLRRAVESEELLGAETPECGPMYEYSVVSGAQPKRLIRHRARQLVSRRGWDVSFYGLGILAALAAEWLILRGR
jgi:hypothetical protein